MSLISEPVASLTRRTRPLILSFVAIAIALALGILGALALGKAERERELRVWQNRLSIVADSRFADISNWLERQFEELAGLAANTSVQLYMTELAAGGPQTPGQDAALATYLRNLLTVTA